MNLAEPQEFKALHLKNTVHFLWHVNYGKICIYEKDNQIVKSYLRTWFCFSF